MLVMQSTAGALTLPWPLPLPKWERKGNVTDSSRQKEIISGFHRTFCQDHLLRMRCSCRRTWQVTSS